MPMALRIQIAKFKIRQYLPRADSPKFNAHKLSRYTVWSNSEPQLLLGYILSACAYNRCQAVFALLPWPGHEDTKGLYLWQIAV